MTTLIRTDTPWWCPADREPDGLPDITLIARQEQQPYSRVSSERGNSAVLRRRGLPRGSGLSDPDEKGTRRSATHTAGRADRHRLLHLRKIDR
jgi:hypothetical protein